MSCRNYLYHSSPVIMLSLRFTLSWPHGFYPIYVCSDVQPKFKEFLCLFLGLFWITLSYCILCPQNSKCFSSSQPYLNTIPIKTPGSCFIDNNTLILKFMWKGRRSRISQPTLKTNKVATSLFENSLNNCNNQDNSVVFVKE